VGTSLGAAVSGLVLQSPVDHLAHLVILVGARPAWTQLFMQPYQALVTA